ncbi:MAG TPA: hypothetical protein VH475_13820 [Tepidisphaeraceae bacterium]
MYSVTDLGTLGGPTSTATALNENGDVVGAAAINDNVRHAFLFRNGQMVDLTPGESHGTIATDVNASDEVVGSCNFYPAGIVYRNGQVDTLFNIYSADLINDNGEIVTTALGLWGWLPGLGQILGHDDYLPGPASGINNAGQIVGGVMGIDEGDDGGFPIVGGYLGNGQSPILLGDGVFPSAINAGGTIVGSTGASYSSVQNRAFVLPPGGTIAALPTLGGDYGEADSVNARGDIVGKSSTARADMHAFLYRGGAVQDLNDLIDPSLGWTLTEATGINDRGQIVGNGINPQGQHHAFLLDPDTDGDGLPDRWETDGIDVDGDGTIDLKLNSNPLHKDVFVELDNYGKVRPLAGALADVGVAFQNAPVANPDGHDGINLHVITSDPSVPGVQFTSAGFNAEIGQLRLQYVGNPGDTAQTRAAKRMAYRYCVFANTFPYTDPDGCTSPVLGLANGIPGNAFTVSLGRTKYEADRDSVAGTFMHELGHTLGLRHGGMDDVQYKPNYISVMNYTWAMPHPADQHGPGYADSWTLDYSRSIARYSIDESDLDERAGLGLRVGFDTQIGTGSLFGCVPVWRVVNETGPVDFSNSDVDGDGVFDNDQHVKADLNGDGILSQLDAALDWPVLVYAVPADKPAVAAGGAVAAPGIDEFDEFGMTVDAQLALDHAGADAMPPRVRIALDPDDPRQVELWFSEDVGTSLSLSDVQLQNVDTGQFLPTSALALAYDPTYDVATVTFPGFAGGVLPDGNYRLVLPAAAVIDGSGAPLDANGDGVGGDDLRFDFFQLAGDANRDRKVDFADLVALAQHYQVSDGLRTLADGDFTGDGNVDFDDLVKLAQNYNRSLDGAPVTGAAAPFATALAATLGMTPPASTAAAKTARRPTTVAKPVSHRPATPSRSSTIAPARKPAKTAPASFTAPIIAPPSAAAMIFGTQRIGNRGARHAEAVWE